MIKKYQAWLVWSVTAAFFFFDYVHQVDPGILRIYYAKSLHASETQIGFIASIYFIPYAIMQIPVGVIIDRFGIKIPLTIAAFTASTFTIMFAFIHTPTSAMALRFLIGCGASFSYVTCLKAVSLWFPNRHFGFMAGLTTLAGTIGAVVAQTPLAYGTQAFGWRHMLLALGCLGYIITLLIYCFSRENNQQQSLQPKQHVWKQLKHLARSKNSWLNAAYAGINNLPLPIIGALWGTQFLIHKHALSLNQSSLINSMMYVGTIPGFLFFGWLSDHMRLRREPMLLAALASALTLCVFLIVPLHLTGLYIAFLLIGFFAGGSAIPYAYGMEICRSNCTGSSLGFINTVMIALSAAAQPLAEFFVRLDHQSFTLTFSLLIAVQLSSAILVYFLDETHCKRFS